MRHRKRGRHFSRTSSHRKALRQSLVNNLFINGRIVTTIEKAKEVKSFAEKMITLGKKAIAVREKDRASYVHKYRLALARLRNKAVVQKLFGEGEWRENGGLAARYVNRNGGFTRILRLSGSRIGVLSGSTFGKVPELKYKMFDVERKIRMVGSNLGDNAGRVIFELVESDSELDENQTEVKPVVSEG